MANKVEVEVALSAKKAQKAVNDLGKSLGNFTKSFGGEFASAEQKYKGFGEQVEKSNKKVQKSIKKTDIAVGSFIGNITSNLALRGLEILKNAPLEAFDAFRQFEKGLIGVEKTANLTESEVDELGKSIKSLSRQIPASTDELLEIATAAGQLGVRGVKNISNFSGTIAKLGRVSNISGEEAALSLTRILNVTGTGIDQIDEFSSVIVALGNNFAATESEIVSITSEVSRATAQFGVSAEESAALGTALRSVGVRAEEAGGVMTKAFIAIQDSITKGGKRMEQLSRLTGIAAKNLREDFSRDALGVFQKLLEGVSKSGANASRELEKIGLSGIRVSKVIPTLSRNTDELQRALELANGEMRNATALNEEFAKSLEGSDSEVQLLRNEMNLLLQDIGEKIAPVFNKGARAVREFLAEMRGEQLDDSKKSLEEIKSEIQAIDEAVKSGFIEREGFLATVKLAQRKKKLEEIRNELELINIKADEGRKFAGQIGVAPQETDVAPPAGTEAKELTPEDKRRIESRKQANIQLRELEAEQKLFEEEQQLLRKEAESELTMQEVERLQEIEHEKLAIKTEAEFEKNALIKDAKLREIADQKTHNKLAIQTEKLHTQQVIAEEKRKAMLRKQVQAAQLSTARNFLAAGITLAKEGSALQKGLLITDATISTWAAANKALAAPPGPPWSIALASSIVAMGLANVAKIAGAKFQDGGVVGGFAGASPGPDNQLAQVRTGEMILNSSQQRNLFDQINSGDFRGENSSVERLSESIERITSQPIVVQIDNKEIARAVRDANRDGFRVSA